MGFGRSRGVAKIVIPTSERETLLRRRPLGRSGGQLLVQANVLLPSLLPYSFAFNGTSFISDISKSPHVPKNSCLSGISAHQRGFSTNSP